MQGEASTRTGSRERRPWGARSDDPADKLRVCVGDPQIEDLMSTKHGTWGSSSTHKSDVDPPHFAAPRPALATTAESPPSPWAICQVSADTIFCSRDPSDQYFASDQRSGTWGTWT